MSFLHCQLTHNLDNSDWFDLLSYILLCMCPYSDVTRTSGSSLTEPLRGSVSDLVQDNTGLLHKLVSEGNVNGVRLVRCSRFWSLSDDYGDEF